MEIPLQPVFNYDRKKLSDTELRNIYAALLKPRLIEEKMLSLLRQGKISKWFSGMGQEAISVGIALAMDPEEFILPMHRNLGIFTARNLDLGRLFAQFQGKESGYTNGRDRSFHFGYAPARLVGMISHLGPQMGIADGIALACKLSREERATFVITGDGGASEGDFHEAVNVAAVWDLPVIIGIENNAWGLSTPSREQFRCRQFTDKAIGYGIPAEDAIQVNGNDILDVYHSVKYAAESIRSNPRPILLEFMTFRRRGHEEASGTKYYPEGLIEEWEKKDPVSNFEAWMLKSQIIGENEILSLREAIKNEIAEGLQRAFAEGPVSADAEKESADLYKPFSSPPVAAARESKKIRFIDAITEGLDEAMKAHPKLVLMGQDIAEYGGVFKVTEGFLERFGKERVRNTPLCESAIIGTALGLSIKGWKGMVEMQFADFVTCGFNQIVNNLAKIHYRWGQNADVVVRMPTGASVGAGPFHSQSNEAWFFHTPGLRIAYPAFPSDAKGLLIRSFEDPNPVMFFEHKALYRSIEGEVPAGYYSLEFGKAAILREGLDCSIITYGLGVHWALNLLDKRKDISADLIDLRTLSPLDYKTIMDSARKTGKVLLLHEDCLTGGIGGEIAARIADECFKYLDAPVMRCAGLDIPIPFAASLEKLFLANDRLEKDLDRLLGF
jgi:2-oxoisovalerate dehydrogenase E1 component